MAWVGLSKSKVIKEKYVQGKKIVTLERYNFTKRTVVMYLFLSL